MIVVLGRAQLQPGLKAQAWALSREHVARSRTEAGCIAHAVHEDPDAADALVFVEEWASMADLQAHFGLPATRAFARALAGMLAAPAQMRLLEATPVPVPGRI